MILKKPYAFFIKMFKPIHLFLSLITLFLINLENNILKFLNSYMHIMDTNIDKSVIESLINKFLYIVPIVMIVFFLFLLGVMLKKKKSLIFYFVGIFLFLIILVINIYVINFLNILTDNVVSIKLIRLIHDLILINLILEGILFVFLLIRGLGIDFKKFNFDSDISKFNINEGDNEEFELNINIDINDKRRQRKKMLRKLKYFYYENKLIIKIFIVIFIILGVFVTLYFIKEKNKSYKEGIYYQDDSIILKVNNSSFLNMDFNNQKLTDDYLIVVSCNMKSIYSNNSISIDDFYLVIDEITFKPVTKYIESLMGLGNFYSETNLSTEYNDYLFIFEIPKEYIKKEMLFGYSSIDIKLKPNDLNSNKSYEIKNIGEEISFESSIGNIKFKINNYDIKDKYLIKYNYCVKKDDCLLSKEYLVPSINKNFDKYILKLDVEYSDNSDLGINNFYDFFDKYGSIYYKIEDKWYLQKNGFEEIISKKTNQKNNIYIGVDSKISSADSIKMVFNIKNSQYEYILK